MISFAGLHAEPTGRLRPRAGAIAAVVLEVDARGGESPRGERPSTVTVELTDHPASGGTLVSLAHSGLADDVTAKANQQGWASVLDMLERRGLALG